MAIIYVRPTFGSDSNGGTSYAAAKQTFAGANAIASATDEICLCGGEGNIALTAVFTLVPTLVYGHPSFAMPVVTGSFTITYSSIISTYVNWSNRAGTAFSCLDSSTLGNTVQFNNCEVYAPVGMRFSTASKIGYYNSKVIMTSGATNILAPSSSVANGMVEFRDCIVRGRICSIGTAMNPTVLNLYGNRWYGVTAGLFRITSEPQFFNISYNTFDGIGSLIEFSNASATITNNLTIFRNYFNTTGALILNTGAGALSMDSVGSSGNNIFHTSSGSQTGYSGTNDGTTSAPLFYDASTNDYRIEIDSPLASYNGDSVGALLPDWDSFWSSVPEAKVEAGYNYRDRSRTNNKTGLLSASGESDPTKVLTTSTAIVGQYVAPSAADVRSGTIFGVSVSGTLNLPSTANVRSGVTFDGGTKTGLLNLPAIGDVRSGTIFDNNTKTGTLDLPSIANVEVGTIFDGTTKTGTYTGANRWTDPGIANVRSATAYKAGSLTNNRTGTLDLPSINDVRQGTIFDNTTKTGLLNLPSIANVRQGTIFDNGTKTGTIVIPSAANVRFGSIFDNGTTGTAHIPTAAETKIGVLVDVSGTGTYVAAERYTDVGEDNVWENASYVFNTVTKYGNRRDAEVERVELGYQYGSTNSPLTGILEIIFPNITDVREGIEYGPGFTGVLSIDDEANLPPEANVDEGIQYGKDLTFTGSKPAPTFPATIQVLDGVEYGDNAGNTYFGQYIPLTPDDVVVDTIFGVGEVGTVVIPEIDHVESGIFYGPQNALEGTLIKLDLAMFTDVPTNKVEAGFQYKYNSLTNNRTGSAVIGDSSIDPGEWNVIKPVDYKINGVDKQGKYDTGATTYSQEGIKVKILEEIKDTLLSVNPANSSAYAFAINDVSVESGKTQGLLEDNMPHVQVKMDDCEYDHKYVLSGNRPMVKMTIKLIVTTPSSWVQNDCETLYEDIRQAFIRDNYDLSGLVLTTELISTRSIPHDDKPSQCRQGEINLKFHFIEFINE